MQSLRRLLIDNKIDRRAFVKGMAEAGVVTAAAGQIANALGAEAEGETTQPASSRFVENMTGGEVMVEFLMDWDVPYMFGLAGSEEIGLLDALVDRPMPFITCLHENACMAMADGYSRSTGKTSIVSLHSVAGAAYALGQLIGSFRDRVPVVVCAGRQATDYRGQDGFLEAANLHTLPEDYAQWTWDVMAPETITEVLRRAFLFAEAPPGGPTFVTFSNDLWEKNVAKAEILPRSRSLVDNKILPSQQHVNAIVDYLMGSDFPVIFLGYECNRFNPSDAVMGIAELLGILVMTGNKVTTLYPTTHAHYGGEFKTDDPDLLKEVDCFWSMGGHMFKVPKKAKEPWLSRDTIIVHTSLAEEDVGRNYPIDSAAYANVVVTADAVLKELEKRKVKHSQFNVRRQRVLEYTSKRRKELDKIARELWDNDPISTPRLMIELDRIMDDQAYIVSETVTSRDGQRKYFTIDHTKPMEERRQCFDTSSGVLGWAVSAAIGVKLGNPKKEVWCLTGDGAFNFSSQTLWSAARYEVPMGIVIFNNGQYQANRKNQAEHGAHRMKATGKYIGVNLGHPDIDYVAQSKAYGVEAESVSDPNELRGALERCQKAMKEGRPYVVDVRIEKRFEGKDSDYYDFVSVAEMQAS